MVTPTMPHSTTAPSSDIPSQITSSILTSHSLPISPSWLRSNLPSSALTNTATSSPPLPSLLKTILFRLLSSDFTVSLSPSSSTTTPTTIRNFPQDLSSPQVQSKHLPRATIPVQILDIISIGTSLSSQLEALESAARGETRRGREIIRTIDVEAGGNGPGSTARNNPVSSTGPGRPSGTSGGSTGGGGKGDDTGPFKILLQDSKGTKIWGYTKTTPIQGINMPTPSLAWEEQGGGGGAGGMAIGCKLLLTDVKVWRGMIMLNRENTRVLGGKVEEWDRVWKDGRLERLRRGIESAGRGGEEE